MEDAALQDVDGLAKNLLLRVEKRLERLIENCRNRLPDGPGDGQDDREAGIGRPAGENVAQRRRSDACLYRHPGMLHSSALDRGTQTFPNGRPLCHGAHSLSKTITFSDWKQQ